MASPACWGCHDARKHPPPATPVLGTFHRELPATSALGQSQKAGAAALLRSPLHSFKFGRRPSSTRRGSSSVHLPLCVWQRGWDSAHQKVLEPLERFFQTLLVPGESPAFLSGPLEGGEETGAELLLRPVLRPGRAPSPALKGGWRAAHGIPGAGALCVAVVFLEPVAISCRVAMHVSWRRGSRHPDLGFFQH